MANEGELQNDLKTAMKARDMDTVYVLRGLLTAIKAVKVDKMIAELPDVEIGSLVRKEIGKRDEAAGYARQANRPDDVDANEREKRVLERYLPTQLDAAALEQAIRAIAAELGTTQIGPIMALLKDRHAGQYDGKLASAIVKTKL